MNAGILRRPLMALSLGLIILAAGMLGWSVVAQQRVANRLQTEAFRFDAVAQDLLQTIGFDGMIHQFKNCVLRPAEPAYCQAASDAALRASALIKQLQSMATEQRLPLSLEAISETVAQYGAQAEIVARRHAEGLPIRAIDTEVRVDDAPAALALNDTLGQVRATLLQRLEELRRFNLWQGIAGLVTVILGGIVFFLLLRQEYRRSVRRERRLSAVFQAVNSTIIGLDAKGRIVMLNAAARRMLGLTSGAVPLDWPADLTFARTGEDGPASATMPLEQVIAASAGKAQTLRLDRSAADLPDMIVRLRSARLNEPGQGLAVVVIMADVTEQERVRHQIERGSRLDALSQLSGGIAHDFNNILAAILYATELAATEDDESRRTDLLRRASDSALRGRSLTARLLTFAKQQPGAARDLRVASVLDDFADFARPLIAKSVAVDIARLEPGLTVHCDPAQLENALLNLTLNARDAIVESGFGGKIRISARSMPAEGADGPGTIVFSVSDDGPGMSDAVRRRATDPYFTTRKNASGTGLGLAMVYGFARQSGGDLSIRSQPGHGTTIRLELPAGHAMPATSRDLSAPAPDVPRGETVLLVEDEDDLRALMTDTLAQMGYSVIAEPNGRAALRQIEAEEDFDILLSDIAMPGGVDGYALADALRRKAPDRRVVLMTGYASAGSRRPGPDSEYPVLHKPCTPRELAAALNGATAGPPPGKVA